MPSSFSFAAFLCGAVVLIAAYHAVFVAPRLRAMAAALSRERGPSPVSVLATPEISRSSVSALPLSQATVSGSVDPSARDTAERLASLEAVVARDLLHVGFVRYNSFVDVGSDQSFTFALLGSSGDGIVVSSIFAREETRTYGKSVRAFVPQQDASQEERAAIALARRDGAFVRA